MESKTTFITYILKKDKAIARLYTVLDNAQYSLGCDRWQLGVFKQLDFRFSSLTLIDPDLRVPTLRQPEDNPDDLAALVESLRYGFRDYSDWTGLLAPLFFERVVRDYISDFAIADEDIESEQN